jgi:hypothetical protein
VTQPSGQTVGPAYGSSAYYNETIFVPFTPEQRRALRGGLSTAKVKTFVPEGFELDHVGSGGMYLRRKVDARTQYRQLGPTTQEAAEGLARHREKQAEALAQTQAFGKKRHAWVDGQFVELTEDENHNLTATPVGGGQGTTLVRPSAFSALDAQSIDESTPFLMSHFQIGGPRSPNPVTGKKATGMFTGLLNSLSSGGQGLMTIGTGVAWLANLSTKDPGAYQAMLDKLHSAGYLSDSDYAQANGHWSTAAGNAFLLAARDVSVVNTTDGGQDTTLEEFLTSKAGAADRERGQGYQPVTRSYTDPAAIKEAARSAAEDLLGRRLTDEEESRLTGHFRSLEDSAYDQVDAIGRSGTGGGSVTRPDPSGQIDSFLDSGPLEQEQANFRAAQLGQAIKRLMGVSTGG